MSLETRIQRIDKRITEREKPKAVLTYSDPLHFATHTLGFVPDDWQAKVLSWIARRLLLLCCRQSGKSTVTAILALHRALYFAKSLILLVSPSLRQSSELFKKVSEFLALLPVHPALIEDNRLSLQLANGSRIVSLPSKESNIRGSCGNSRPACLMTSILRSVRCWRSLAERSSAYQLHSANADFSTMSGPRAKAGSVSR